ncbi:MAG: alkaline phosphatase [Corallococcus sp.]|nr:alkaline phosphatase [Corallococcus sp.]MCM1359633.1 alkaline phosphatase [Corallococcus sp.]MCM1395225.1 alkaline phosphatase [Corallococcus sp.]
MKKLFCLVAIILILCTCLTACATQNFELTAPNDVKNVIVIIGDGMGFNHIKNTKTYFGEEGFPFDDLYECEITTRSKSSSVTDSAASATAIATGIKVDNRNVGRLDGKDLETIMDIAAHNGKKTGIVTNDYLYGATPAGFSSHADDRGDTGDIVNGQAVSNIDLMIGAMNSSNTYARNADKFESNGYTLVESLNQLNQTSYDQKVIANLTGLRSTHNENLANQVGMIAAVQYALDYLNNDNGFCLMIESAYIDKCNHTNDAYGSICEVRMLADIIQTVLEFCGDRNDTAVIVTADHESGGMQLATDKSGINNDLYTQTEHTGVNVPLYIKGFELSGYKKALDNTDIFKMCKMLITKQTDL